MRLTADVLFGVDKIPYWKHEPGSHPLRRTHITFLATANYICFDQLGDTSRCTIDLGRPTACRTRHHVAPDTCLERELFNVSRTSRGIISLQIVPISFKEYMVITYHAFYYEWLRGRGHPCTDLTTFDVVRIG
jgi:Fe-S-cluster containining protein